MELHITPFIEIAAALDKEKITGVEQRYCNTCFHKPEEITAALPDIQHKPPDSGM